MAYNWPSGHKAGTTTTDAATDRIDLARADIQQNIVNVNEIIDMFDLDAEPANGQILKYDTSADQFVLASDATASGIALTDLSVTDAGGDGSLAYNNSTGVFTYTGPSASEVRAHVSVTQASASALGTLAYNSSTGVFTYTPPKLTGTADIWVPVQAMYPTADGGSSSITTVEVTEGRPELRVLDFDKDTTEFAQFSIAMPKSWNEGTITFEAYWTAASGSGGCSWGLQGVAISDDDAVATAFGTAVVVDDTLIAANDLHISPTSSAITIAGTPAAGDLCFFQVFRDHDDSNDTLSVDARLIGIKIHYTTEAGTDD